ncbi:hypothetical protein ALC62_01320 [Cyphomyrmex costatus]|uniref:Uncharacterized protein n=1 Tax=Cyphomyrmex costatus TaxID=456900 RepID=A0A195D5V0_9HYME|nr:hypothetical protein ALC62_01320 [Cyphomyrmex costatus]
MLHPTLHRHVHTRGYTVLHRSANTVLPFSYPEKIGRGMISPGRGRAPTFRDFYDPSVARVSHGGRKSKGPTVELPFTVKEDPNEPDTAIESPSLFSDTHNRAALPRRNYANGNASGNTRDYTLRDMHSRLR